MGLFNVLGSLQNIESAESAGDSFRTRPSLLANGAGSLVAALFGSPFPTTIYIGHPGWKAMGARSGYSVLNGIFITALALSGTLGLVVWAVPIDAGMAIVLWIGIVITAQSFQTIPRSHAPAAVIGLLPALAAWGALLAKNSLRAAGLGTPAAPFTPSLIDAFLRSDTWIHGAFALEQGFIATSMALAAATVHIIERKFRLAALWFLGLALLSLTGLVHSYRFAPGDTVGSLTPAWPWFWGYLGSAALLAVAPWITEDAEGH
jgi:AGZA family xanthine/uracil permease-like MFS transporter